LQACSIRIPEWAGPSPEDNAQNRYNRYNRAGPLGAGSVSDGLCQVRRWRLRLGHAGVEFVTSAERSPGQNLQAYPGRGRQLTAHACSPHRHFACRHRRQLPCARTVAEAGKRHKKSTHTLRSDCAERCPLDLPQPAQITVDSSLHYLYHPAQLASLLQEAERENTLDPQRLTQTGKVIPRCGQPVASRNGSRRRLQAERFAP
jgi:hypothetical protein